MAENPLDALRTQSATATATPEPPAPAATGNPLDALRHAPAAAPVQAPSFLGEIGNAARTVATGVGNVLDAQRWAVAKAVTGKSDTGEQRTAERQAVGTQGIYDALGKIPVVGHALQGTSDVVQDTLTDPLTLETLGAGPLLKATGLGVKAAEAAGTVGKAITDTPGGALLHDTLNWGGQVTRERGAATTNQIRGALNKGSATGTKVAQQYQRLSQGIVNGLTDDEKMNVRKTLNGEALPEGATLTAKEQTAAKNLRRLTELDYKQRYQAMMAERFNEVGYRLQPADRTALATALRTGTRPAAGPLADAYDTLQMQVKEAMPYRENYAPTVHEDIAKAPTEGTEAKTVSPADAFDVRNLHRENVVTDRPEQLEEGFNALASNAGRQANKRVIHESLGDLVNDPAVKSLISDTIKATGEKRTNVQKVGDAWLKVIGYPRAATVSLTPRHVANIIDLAANTVPPQEFPAYMARVTSLTAKLLKSDEKQYANLTKDGRDLGAISSNFAERKPFFQNVPVLKNWTQANNKLVWAVDTAAKQEYAALIKRMHPELSDLEAGGQAASRLVDYEHVSPAVKALRYVAPFGTFRGSIPGAVLGGIARNPARAALLNRASGGTMYGSRPGKGQSGAEFYGPTSDVARGLDAPQDFIRGTLGQPVQAAATMGIEAATGNPGASAQTTLQELRDLPNQIMRGQFSKMGVPGKISPYAKAVALRTARYLNYRHPIDLQFLTDWAASGVPEAGAVLEMLGHSQFSNPNGPSASSMGNEALRQSTGISLR